MTESFLKYLQYEKRYSAHTLNAYASDLEQFGRFCEKTYHLDDLSEVSYAIIRSWMVDLMEQKLSPRAINRKQAALKTFYNFLLRREVIDENPTRKLKSLKIPRSIPHFVPEEEALRLIDNHEYDRDFKGQRDKVLLEILYGTGIRLSELIHLKEADVNFYQQQIKVLGKRNKERLVPISKSLSQSIQDYVNYKKNNYLNGYLLLTDKGEQMYPMFVYRIVNRYLKLFTSAAKCSPHILRHTFATHLLNRGAELAAVKDLLGHESLAATQVYTHNTLEKLKKVHAQAHPKA